MATSGTVGATVFRTRKVIDLAMLKSGVLQQQITSEHISTALDLLFLNLSELATYGIPLWAIEKSIVPIYRGQRSVPLPVGTVDVFNFNLRQLTRNLGQVDSASEGVAANAFDGDLDTACTQVAPAGWIQTDFGDGNATQIDNYGIFFNASGTWDVEIQGSQDGVSFTSLYANDALAAVEGDWFWLDLEEQIPWRYVRLQANGATVLDVAEFYLGSNGSEIPMAKVNRDDYSNLPDKTFLSRPTEYWYDKQAAAQGGRNIATVWPVPDTQYTFYQYVLYLKRQIQDVGSMSQELEVPQRWYKAIVADLAVECCLSIREADLKRLKDLQDDRDVRLRMAWTSEDDGSPVRLQPRISPYTR